MKIINLDDVGRRIFQAKGNPGLLDDINIELSSWYAYYAEQEIGLEYEEAVFYQNTKDSGEKKTSDKAVESMWKLTEKGQNHVRVVQTIKILEKLMSNLKASIRRAEMESRNLT